MRSIWLLFCFKDEGTEIQRGKEICPRLRDKEVAGLRLTSRSSGSVTPTPHSLGMPYPSTQIINSTKES